MDATPVLASMASLFPSLPVETVEDQLVTFDALVNVSDPEHRPAAAVLLRTAAESSQDPARRERLLKAADAVAAGQPCAFTPEGLSAAQAAAAQTITAEEWERQMAAHPLPSPPSDSAPTEDDKEDDEDGADAPDHPDHMNLDPPKLPHLAVRNFFPGLVIRVAQKFVDAQGRAVAAGDLLTLLSCERIEAGGYLLNLLVRTVRLPAGVAYNAMLENAANAWFQPVPTIDCLHELWQAIDMGLSDAEADNEDDGDDDDRLETLGVDIEACETWLSRDGNRGPAPECRTIPLATRIFGRDHQMTAWIRLLYAGLPVALP